MTKNSTPKASKKVTIRDWIRAATPSQICDVILEVSPGKAALVVAELGKRLAAKGSEAASAIESKFSNDPLGSVFQVLKGGIGELTKGD